MPLPLAPLSSFITTWLVPRNMTVPHKCLAQWGMKFTVTTSRVCLPRLTPWSDWQKCVVQRLWDGISAEGSTSKLLHDLENQLIPKVILYHSFCPPLHPHPVVQDGGVCRHDLYPVIKRSLPVPNIVYALTSAGLNFRGPLIFVIFAFLFLRLADSRVYWPNETRVW